jgi:hypothetical protein
MVHHQISDPQERDRSEPPKRQYARFPRMQPKHAAGTKVELLAKLVAT